MSQTSYSEELVIARKGMLADTSPKRADSYLAEGNLTFGNLVQRGTSEDQVIPMAALPSADADSIIETAVATAASETVFSGGDFDGVIGSGDGMIVPAQQVTLTLTSHADFDASTATVFGADADGNPISEELVVPDGGAAVLTTVAAFGRVDRIRLDAQSGTGGELTAGTSPVAPILGKMGFPGFLLYDPTVEPASAAAELGDEEAGSVLVEGRIYVQCEGAVAAGNPCYVRVVEDGTDLRGQVRGDYAANFAPILGCSFLSSCAADGFAVLEVK